MKRPISVDSKCSLGSPHAESNGTDREGLRILLLVSAYNGLTQAAHQLLERMGHFVTIQYASKEAVIWSAVESNKPDVIICPFLKEFVPLAIFKAYKTLIVHPGIVGDRGPSSLDWAILQGKREWGVVVVEGHEMFDAGDVWASRTFLVPKGITKSRMYGELVTNCALDAIKECVNNFYDWREGTFKPETIDFEAPWVLGKNLPLMKQSNCAIDWGKDSAEDIVRKVSARDGQPGVLDKIGDHSVYMYGAHLETSITGQPKEILATRNGAVCFGAMGGAVWITHMRVSKLKEDAKKACVPHATKFYKLPAAIAMKSQLGLDLKIEEVPAGILPVPHETWQDIVYQKRGNIGVVLFQFYNGAMGTSICRRLVACLQHAKEQKDTKVIVLAGGGVLTNHAGYFSNGIDLNSIDFAADPKQEGWENINAIDDVVLEILSALDHLTIACICGNAGAGGIMVPLGADMVVAKTDLVFNPHYGTMGLYGSEYWTYSLPKRVGKTLAEELTTKCLPITSENACDIGMLDKIFPGSVSAVLDKTIIEARRMALSHMELLAKKKSDRARDEEIKPLRMYRDEELKNMYDNFFNDSCGFSQKCVDFVQKNRQDEAPPRITKPLPVCKRAKPTS